MAKYTKLIRLTPPAGYRWKVISEGRTVASGSAASDLEARIAANEATSRLMKENGSS